MIAGGSGEYGWLEMIVLHHGWWHSWIVTTLVEIAVDVNNAQLLLLRYCA